jgi:hypothetical protein
VSDQPRSLRIGDGDLDGSGDGGGSGGAAGGVEHASVWDARALDLGPPGRAYVPFGEPAPDDRPSIAVTTALHAEAPPNPEAVFVLDLASATGTSVDAVDSAWRAGALGGVVVDAASARRGEDAVVWACARGALLLIRAADWDTGMRAAAKLAAENTPPVLVLDPALSSGRVDVPGFDRALARAAELDHVHLVAEAAAVADRALAQDQLPALLLASGEGAQPVEAAAAAENLRYLCERTRLLSLRARSGRSLAEVGRLPSLDQAP